MELKPCHPYPCPVIPCECVARTPKTAAVILPLHNPACHDLYCDVCGMLTLSISDEIAGGWWATVICNFCQAINYYEALDACSICERLKRCPMADDCGHDDDDRYVTGFAVKTWQPGQ